MSLTTCQLVNSRLICSKFLRFFQHTTGTYPKPPSNSLWFGIPLHLGEKTGIHGGMLCSRGMLSGSLRKASWGTFWYPFPSHHLELVIFFYGFDRPWDSWTIFYPIFGEYVCLDFFFSKHGRSKSRSVGPLFKGKWG